MGERWEKAGAAEPWSQKAPSRVADHLVRALQGAGIDRVFGIPGGAISPLFDALIGSDIEVVVAQHEAMAVYEATGWSRATGKPGVVLVTSGPGVLNTTTPVAAAKLDEVPLVILAGDVSGAMSGRGSLQDGGANGLDIVGVMRSLTKRVEVVSGPGRALTALHQALEESQVHPKGPVLLDIAMDLGTIDVEGAGFHGRAMGPAPASAAVCQRIAEHLAQATRPVLWLGVGARNTELGQTALRLAERTRCAVITDIEAKGLIPESHALSLGLFGVGSRGLAERFLASGFDFLLTVGARLDDTTTGGFSELLKPSGVMVQLDHDPARLSRAYAFHEVVHCDLAETLARIEHGSRAPAPHLLLARDAAIREARAAVPLLDAPALTRGPHHPAAVIRALQAAMPKDTVFTTDIGNHLIFAAQHLRLERPGTFHVSNGLGGMGSGIGTAIGLAQGGERPVVGICGDGSFRMVGSELATCVAHGVPVVLAVLDDGQLGMVEHGLKRLFGRADFTRSPAVDVVAWARAMGATAVRIDRERDLHAALGHLGAGPLVLHFPVRAEVEAHNPRADVFAFPSKR